MASSFLILKWYLLATRQFDFHFKFLSENLLAMLADFECIALTFACHPHACTRTALTLLVCVSPACPQNSFLGTVLITFWIILRVNGQNVQQSHMITFASPQQCHNTLNDVLIRAAKCILYCIFELILS